MATAATTAKAATRAKTNIFLVDYDLPDPIRGARLPSNGEVLRRFMYRHKSQPIRSGATDVADEINVFWDKARIPVRQRHHVIKGIENLYQQWRMLVKHKTRATDAEEAKRRDFKESLNNLFDISHRDAEKLMNNQEDVAFLRMQRKPGRPGCMAGSDAKLATKEKKHQEKSMTLEKRKVKSKDEVTKLMAKVEFVDTDTDTDSSMPSSSTASSPEKGKAPLLKRARRGTPVLTPDVAATLDHIGMSDRKAMHVTSSLLRSQSSNETDPPPVLSVSTIRRVRMKYRSEAAKDLFSSFNKEAVLTVHWDGKILPELTGKGKVDRLPVVVTGIDLEKILEIPPLPSGRGVVQANAVFKALDDAELTRGICAMSFDTTSSNTGKHNGACTLLEDKLGRQLLNLACRHHVLELVIGKAFNVLMGPSTGPDIVLFKRFQERWPAIDKSQYQSLADLEMENGVTLSLTDVPFILERLQEDQPRDDYRELLELWLIVLGQHPPRGVRFMAPGAMHRARWMGKVIYALKMFLFRSQCQLNKRQGRELLEFVQFSVVVYLRAWYTASLSTAAPKNDLELLKRLGSYEKNKRLAKEVFNTLINHLWYLGHELIGLSFFDLTLSSEQKRKMVKSLSNPLQESNRLKANKQDFARLAALELKDFVTEGTWDFFLKLNINTSFLDSSPDHWEDNSDFQEGLKKVKSLKVVNDCAERGVALIQELCRRTKDEEQLQYLIQVVENHRKTYKTVKKVDLLSGRK